MVLRGPEVEPNAEVFARSVETVNCIRAIGAQRSGSGTECGRFEKSVKFVNCIRAIGGQRSGGPEAPPL